MQRIFRQSALCLAIVVGINGIGLLAVIEFGRRMDPFALHHSADYIPPLPPNSARIALSSYSYLEKAADIIRVKPGHIILGSSIADTAFRIRGSAARWYNPYPEKTLAILKLIDNDASYYNASVRGGGIYEAWLMLQHSYINNPHMDKVILGTEWSMFSQMLPMPATPALSAYNKTSIPLDFYLEYTISPMALQKAYEVLAGAHPHTAAWIARITGFFSIAEQRWEQWNQTPEPSFSTAPPLSYATLQPGEPSSGLLQGSTPYELHKFVFNIWSVTSFRAAYDKGGLAQLMPANRFEVLRRLVAFCHEQHIDLQVYRSPQHPLFWAMMHHFGMDSAVDYWLREEATIVPTWDFSMLVDYRDPDRYFTTDTLHFSEEAGEVLLPILRQPRNNAVSGVMQITANNIEAVVVRRKQLLDQWLAGHPEIDRTINAVPVDRLLRSDMFQTSLGQLMPTPYSPAYKGYKIIKFISLYFALPSDIPAPYDLHKFVQKTYPRMLDADTLQGICHKIDETQPNH